MKAYLFPFKQISENLRIVLYAAGAVGQAYYQQLTLTEYADVVLWVDKSSKQNGVSTLTELLSLEPSAYDLVIIAVGHDTIANEIRGDLVSNGIENDKVMHVSPIETTINDLTGQQSALTIDVLLSDNKDKISDALDDYLLYSNGCIDYFSKLIKEIATFTRNDNQRKKSLCKDVVNYISVNNPTPRHALILLRLLYESECFYSEALQCIVRNIGLLSPGSPQQYWSFVDICSMWFTNPHALYDDFFPELHELSEKIAIGWDLSWKPPKNKSEGNKDICVLVPYLIPGAVTAYLSPIIGELAERGYKMHVLDIEFSLYDGGTDFLKPLGMSYISNSIQNAAIRKLFPDSVMYHYAAVKDVRERQQRVLSIVSEINPLCVIDASVEVGVISYYIYKDYPVIKLPLRNQGFASTFFHKCVIFDGVEAAVVHPPLKEEQALRLPLLIEYNKPVHIFRREVYGLAADDVVVITVGSRLSHDISNDLAENMCSFLRLNKGVRWLIVGCHELPYINSQHEDLIDDSIIFIDYEKDLPGLYGICDVYLNPSRIGGGLSVAWAMQQGLVIVSPLDASDCIIYIGTENAVANECDLVPYIAKLAEDNALMECRKRSFRNITDGWDVKNSIDILVREMEQLTNEFNKI